MAYARRTTITRTTARRSRPLHSRKHHNNKRVRDLYTDTQSKNKSKTTRSKAKAKSTKRVLKAPKGKLVPTDHVVTMRKLGSEFGRQILASSTQLAVESALRYLKTNKK